MNQGGTADNVYSSLAEITDISVRAIFILSLQKYTDYTSDYGGKRYDY